jgi:hypothetical protein
MNRLPDLNDSEFETVINALSLLVRDSQNIADREPDKRMSEVFAEQAVTVQALLEKIGTETADA